MEAAFQLEGLGGQQTGRLNRACVFVPEASETETGTQLVLTAIGCLGSWAN